MNMVTTEMTVRPDANIAYGNREEIDALAKRIKTMLPGGDKLSANEALALAQVATVTRLNPFVGEVWYIPGHGPMIGIKGARRMENEDTAKKGGYSWMQFDVIAPEDSGAQDPKKVFRAYKCTINDVNATKAYLAIFHDALEMLRTAQTKDPYAEAKEICGPRPLWEGYGFSLIGESSRMNPDALARKRAEADALKKRIVLPFGAEVSENDGGYIEGEVQDVASESVPEQANNEEQNLHDLGHETTEPEAEPAPDPEAEAYNAALAIWATDKDKKKVQFGTMTSQQLQYIATTSSVTERVEAALLILEKKFNMPRPGAA
jgi:hypothetical protein